MSNLLAAYQAGDAEAFLEFYAAMRPVLGRHLMSLGADDRVLEVVLDHVFLEIHAARPTWNPGSPVERWAMAIAEHVFGREIVSTRCRGSRKMPRYGSGGFDDDG
jgi:DNA-directed RNA polymerase specialized sigma24 family protein